jgi:hypothetical protein
MRSLFFRNWQYRTPYIYIYDVAERCGIWCGSKTVYLSEHVIVFNIILKIFSKRQYYLHRFITHNKIYLLYSEMQHKQTHHLFDEVHTAYFQEKHSTLIYKQCFNTVTLH